MDTKNRTLKADTVTIYRRSEMMGNVVKIEARGFDARIHAHLEATGARILWGTRGEAIA